MPQPLWPGSTVEKLPIPETPGQVVVVSFRTGVEAGLGESMLAILDPGERERWNRTQSPKVKDEFLSGRSLVRRVLGHMAGCTPESLAFTHNPKGKPDLSQGGLAFNLSHSHGLGLLAVARKGRLGVDLEQARPMNDPLGLARRYFTPAEVAAIEGTNPSLLLDIFYRVWTRKEAFIKAQGEGVAYGLDRVQVTSLIGFTPRFEKLAPGDDPAGWSLADLEPAHAYHGALALDNPVIEPLCHHCPGWVV